ncbi:MAG: hypothetical protein GC162_19560 [Planctomycetes bacterium]|nr:hypothetical protein [Planctomycetota bacterium]
MNDKIESKTLETIAADLEDASRIIGSWADVIRRADIKSERSADVAFLTKRSQRYMQSARAAVSLASKSKRQRGDDAPPMPIREVERLATMQNFGRRVMTRAKKELDTRTIAQLGTFPPVYHLQLPDQKLAHSL